MDRKWPPGALDTVRSNTKMLAADNKMEGKNQDVTPAALLRGVNNV